MITDRQTHTDRHAHYNIPLPIGEEGLNVCYLSDFLKYLYSSYTVADYNGKADGLLLWQVSELFLPGYMERKCADTTGTELVPWAGHF